jgi:hypothetical protein
MKQEHTQKLLALTAPTAPIGSNQVLTGTSIVNLIQSLVQILLTVSIVLGVGFFIYGAIQYIGLGAEEDGKKKMKNAVIGIALIMALGLILNSIAACIGRGLQLG